MVVRSLDLRAVLVSGLAVAAVLMLVPFATVVAADVSKGDVDVTLASPGSRILRVGWPDLQSDIQTLNPLYAVFDAEFFVIWSCYSTLLTEDVDGNLIGDLAVEWEILPDGLTWHIEIVETAKFYDRTDSAVQQPLTAADVIFTYWLVQNTTADQWQHYFPQIPSAGGSLIEAMWASGDYELWIKLRVQFAPFATVLKTVPILPQYIWSSEPADWDNYNANYPPIVGSGPWYYELDAEPDAGFVSLCRSPTWFGTAEYGWQLHVNELVLRSETEESNLANYLSGNNDVMVGVTQSQYTGGGLVGTKWQSSQGFVFEFNMNQLTEEDRVLYDIGGLADYNNQLLLDPVVKRALQMSIDKDAIVRDTLEGLGQPADSLIPASSPWRYDYGGPDAPLNESELPFDIYNARMLLYASGWHYRSDGSLIQPSDADYLTYCPLSKSSGGVATDTLYFRFATPAGYAFFGEASSLIEQWAAQTGIDLVYSTETELVMNNMWYNADYDTWYWDWLFTPNSEPSVDIMYLLTTDAIGEWSDVYWSNETYDALYAESVSELNASARSQILDEMQRIAYEESGCWPVAWLDTLYAGQSVSPEYWQNYGNWSETYPLTIDSGYPWLFTQIYPMDNPAPQIIGWTSYYECTLPDPNAFTATAVDSDELEFMWNFGDGTKSAWLDSPNVTHTYSEDGYYDAWLMVREVGTLDGFITSEKAVVRVVDPTQSPPSDLDFTYEPSNPDTGTFVFFNGTAVDADGDPLSFTWDFGDGCTAAGQDVTHQFSVGAGSYEVTMGVDDGRLGLEPRPVYLAKTVTVTENSPPWVVLPDYLVVQWKVLWEFEVSAGDSDAADVLRFTWDWGDGSELTVTENTTAYHTYNQKLLYNLTVWCDDLTGLDGHNVSDSAIVVSGFVPEAPVITLFSVSTNTPFVGTPVEFQGNATDSFYDLLRYSFDFGDGSYFNATSYPDIGMSVNHSYSSPGVYLAFLTVSDGMYEVGTVDPIVMDVSENHPPLITVLDVPDVPVKVAYEFSVAAFDPDPADSLLFTWYWGDGTLNVTTELTEMHTYERKGVYNMTVWADDQTGLAGHNVSDTGTVLVVGPQSAPYVVDFRVSNETPLVGQMVTFSGTAIDVDDDLLTFFWDFGDGGTSTSAEIHTNTAVNVSHVYLSSGSVVASLYVSDGYAFSDSVEVIVEVQPDVLPPLIEIAVSGNPVMVGETVTLDGSGSSDDVGIVDYVWTFMDGTTPVELHGEIVNYTFMFGPQSVLITLNVTDAEGNWNTKTVTLEISGVIPEMPLMPVILAVVAMLALLGAVRRGRRDRSSP